MLTIREECELHAKREALDACRYGIGVAIALAAVAVTVAISADGERPGFWRVAAFEAVVVAMFCVVGVRLRRRIHELEELDA